MKYRWFYLAVASVLAMGWGLSGLTRHAIAAIDRWGAAAPKIQPTLDRANTTLDKINAPCTGFNGSTTCGPIAQLSQTAKNIGIVAGQSALQVKQSGELIDSAATNLNLVARSIQGTADAATGTLTQASATLGEGQRALAGFEPLLGQSTQAVIHFDALLKDKAIAETMANVSAITLNTAGITGNLNLISAHFERTVDSPRPLWKTAIPMMETSGKFYACIVHHVCVN